MPHRRRRLLRPKDDHYPAEPLARPQDGHVAPGDPALAPAGGDSPGVGVRPTARARGIPALPFLDCQGRAAAPGHPPAPRSGREARGSRRRRASLEGLPPHVLRRSAADAGSRRARLDLHGGPGARARIRRDGKAHLCPPGRRPAPRGGRRVQGRAAPRAAGGSAAAARVGGVVCYWERYCERGCIGHENARRNRSHVRRGASRERATGLEPATSSLGSWHSTTELRPRLRGECHRPAGRCQADPALTSPATLPGSFGDPARSPPAPRARRCPAGPPASTAPARRPGRRGARTSPPRTAGAGSGRSRNTG
jgi:hypothetical protein